MKNTLALGLSVLLLTANAVAAPRVELREEVKRASEDRKIEVLSKGLAKSEQENKLAGIVKDLARNGADLDQFKAATKNPIAAAKIERLARAEEALRTKIDKSKFEGEEIKSVENALAVEAEFVSLLDRTSNAEGKALVEKMISMDIFSMNKEDRDSHVRVRRAALDARTSKTMDGDIALTNALRAGKTEQQLKQKIAEILGCK